MDPADGAGWVAEHPHRPLRRHRAGGVVAVRRAHRACRRCSTSPTTGSPTRSGTRRHCARPTRSCLLTGRNHHQNGFACDRRGRRPGSPGYERLHPDGERLRSPRSCASRATTRSGSARTTTCRPTRGTWAASKAEWPLAAGFDRFYGFIGGETNQWYPDARRRQPLRGPAVPARGRLPPLEGPRRQGDHVHPRLQAVASRDKPWYMWFCPGANHAPHHAPQEYIDKYAGAVRRRLRGVPRVGAAADDRARHPARGHRAVADQPDDRGHVLAGRPRAAVGLAERRREARCSAAWPRSTPGSPSTPTHQVGRIVDYLEESGQLENTLIFYCADNGASGEGSAERLGQREQVLQRAGPTTSPRTSR